MGTTDSESELTMTPKPTDEEVNFIIQVRSLRANLHVFFFFFLGVYM